MKHPSYFAVAAFALCASACEGNDSGEHLESTEALLASPGYVVELTPEQRDQIEQFKQCLRDHGVDVPEKGRLALALDDGPEGRAPKRLLIDGSPDENTGDDAAKRVILRRGADDVLRHAEDETRGDVPSRARDVALHAAADACKDKLPTFSKQTEAHG